MISFYSSIDTIAISTTIEPLFDTVMVYLYANTEHLTDPMRREPCMNQAHLDYNKINTCSHNASQYLPIEIAINTTRAPMYQAIQPNPGYFPHIFIDGHHQYNDSWTALLRTLCTKNNMINSPACDLQQGILFSFNIGNNVTKGC